MPPLLCLPCLLVNLSTGQLVVPALTFALFSLIHRLCLPGQLAH